jgi:hypothetical protein
MLSGIFRPMFNLDDDLKICDIVNPPNPFAKLVLERKESSIKTSYDACTCEWHNSKRDWRCANEEAVDLDLGFLNSLVEHLHATRQDLCSKTTLITADMDFSNMDWRRQLGARSFPDAIPACVIYTLGWTLVTTEDLQLDINELLR